MKRNKHPFLLAMAVVFLPSLGWSMPWSWDMFKQPSHKAQENVAPPTPKGATSTGGPSLHIRTRVDAARVSNPVRPNQASLERGKVKFNTYCAPCHGEKGIGDGPVGKKFIPPTDLTSIYVQQKTDGDIFYTITYGGLAVMPGHGDAIQTEDRWHIVNYIKHFLGNQTVTK